MSKFSSISDIRQLKNLFQQVYTKKDKAELAGLMFFNLSLSILEIIGIGLASFVALIITKSGTSKTSLDSSFMNAIDQFNEWQFLPKSPAYLVIIVLGISILKNVLSVAIIKFTFTKLAKKSQAIALDWVTAVLNFKWTEINKVSSQELAYVLNEGLSNFSIGIIATLLAITSELIVLTLMLTILCSINPLATLFIGVYFFLVISYLVLHFGTQTRVATSELNTANLAGEVTTFDLKNIFREIKLFHADDFFTKKYLRSRTNAVRGYTRAEFGQQIPKYFLEISALFGTLLLMVLTNIGILSQFEIVVFFFASTRIIPSLLRLQGAWLGANRGVGYVISVLPLMQKICDHSMHGRNEKSDKTANVWRSDFAIEARNVDFRYEGAIDLVLTDINLTVEAGKAVAIVGASGAGKSTLVNLLIGSLRPTSGEISVLGETPELGRSSSHTKIAFLPQNSGAITGSVFENLTFKSGVDNNEDLIVNEILTDIGLGNLAQTLPSGLESQLSPGVSQLSSGQLQRLLLGRALFAKPNLIILDEPTSSLDDSTSNLIDLSLSILKGSTTIVVITHKKPNPDLFDEVYEVQNGKLNLIFHN